MRVSERAGSCHCVLRGPPDVRTRHACCRHTVAIDDEHVQIAGRGLTKAEILLIRDMLSDYPFLNSVCVVCRP